MPDATRIYYSLEDKPIKDIVKVGQKVYVVPAGNMTRRIKDSVLNHAREATVEKVGRKYFYVDGIKFGVVYGYIREISNYTSDYHLILSKEDLEDAKLNIEIHKTLDRFSGYGGNMEHISIEDKVKIADILKKYLD